MEEALEKLFDVCLLGQMEHDPSAGGDVTPTTCAQTAVGPTVQQPFTPARRISTRRIHPAPNHGLTGRLVRARRWSKVVDLQRSCRRGAGWSPW